MSIIVALLSLCENTPEALTMLAQLATDSLDYFLWSSLSESRRPSLYPGNVCGTARPMFSFEAYQPERKAGRDMILRLLCLILLALTI